VSICSIDGDLKEKLRKFRFRKATNNAAVVSKKTFFILVMSGPNKNCTFFYTLYRYTDERRRFSIKCYEMHKTKDSHSVLWTN